jgi:hypothetical protein
VCGTQSIHMKPGGGQEFAWWRGRATPHVVARRDARVNAERPCGSSPGRLGLLAGHMARPRALALCLPHVSPISYGYFTSGQRTVVADLFSDTGAGHFFHRGSIPGWFMPA